jgi:ADP-ribose pyrophosphatase YjhB (NUDIX family)
MAMPFRRASWPNRLMHIYWRFSRGLTMGVRAMVLDGEGRVLLIEHSYTDGWHMPGGGVEVGETLLEALGRELAEEASIELTGPPVLHGVYFATAHSRRDHVAVYVVRDFRQTGEKLPDREIIGHGFFPLDALPEGTTKSTRDRIAEVLHGAPKAERW